MRDLDGWAWTGVGLFVFGICLAAMGTALIINGEVAIGVMAIVVAVVMDMMIGSELWKDWRP